MSLTRTKSPERSSRQGARPEDPRLPGPLQRRILLISGKGGVGRTVLAAACARVAADAGRRVLLCELGDPEGQASPLARLFGLRDLPIRPERVAPGILACQIDGSTGHELFLRSVLPSATLASAALRSKVLRAFLLSAPSFLEMGWLYHMFALLKARRKNGEPEYEHFIVDMPATGHTLALSGLPEILLRLITRGPIHDALVDGLSLFNSPEQTAAWVVTLPETLPVSEALELIDGLRRNAIPVGGVILNRMPVNPFTDEERATLLRLLEQQPVHGALELRRIERSLQAEQRLRRETSLPVIEVEEFDPTDPSPLPERIARSLVRDATPEAP